MNLLPATEKYILKKGLKLRIFVVACLLLTISFLLAPFIFLPAFILTRERLNLVNLPTQSNEVTDDENILNILKLPEEVNAKMAFFQTNIGDRGVTDALFKIVSNLPTKVRLNSIVFNKNQSDKGKKGINIVIGGMAQDRESLISFGESLRLSKNFNLVDVPVSSLAKDKNLPFLINLSMEI